MIGEIDMETGTGREGAPNPKPIATYRVQLRPGFGFDQAAGIVAYLADLGVSHLYTSPYLQAAAGSSHGYDIVDPSRVNGELGGAEGHARLCATLQTAGLGHMIDVVPNHMAVSGPENPWWWDVLENGRSSRYSRYFDIDWQVCPPRRSKKLLLPVLGDHYGRVLEGGQLQLSHHEGVFRLHYFDQRFPIAPFSLAALIDRAAEAVESEQLASFAESLARTSQAAATPASPIIRHRQPEEVFSTKLADICRRFPEAGAAIDAQVASLNRDPDALDALIDKQYFRLAFWRLAATDLGYRRFFDIKELIGVRVETEEVFCATHNLPIAWVRKGWVQGLRIDHPDGLLDPAAYFQRLRRACPHAWIVAEKILAPGESLPPDWPVAGTTGYDYLNLVGGLFIDPKGEEGLTRFYEDFTGEAGTFREVGQASKRWVLTHLLASELNRLTRLFARICERHRRHRDYAGRALREALCETAVCLPVYRTYVSAADGRVGRADERCIDEAIAMAGAQRSDLDPELFGFLKDLLLLRVQGRLEGELAMRFQQLTGPAMAKGVEDTAFYRYNRLVGLNEVGGDPSRFGVSPAQFHRTCDVARTERPFSMLATATHDTKRGEDVRARLALLSEIPRRWADAVVRWAGHNRRHGGRSLPDRNTEYLLYQTLVGAWPIDSNRMLAYMEKAVREAKRHTCWTRPNEDYEKGLREFIVAVMADQDFLSDLEDFVAGLVIPGRINSLAQTLIKLTAPGIPDIYQGTELWDLSLVDPDNRRPVDFDRRRRLLAELDRLAPEDILARMDDALPKLWLIRQALRLRGERPGLFGPQGTYRPMFAHGAKADHVIAFVRGEEAVAVAPRLILGLDGDWGTTLLELPPGRWRNVLTGDAVQGGARRLKTLLARFPVGLVLREG
jgi:(1->4)-alpha-D-glucan 1-alpha-D-glucosylmutase